MNSASDPFFPKPLTPSLDDTPPMVVALILPTMDEIQAFGRAHNQLHVFREWWRLELWSRAQHQNTPCN
jgi:hypothetical protein